MQDAALLQQLSALLRTSHGNAARIVEWIPAGASSFARTAGLTLQDGTRFFLKHSSSAPAGIFAREHEALALLHGTSPLAVPAPIASGPDFLLTEWLEFGRRGAGWEEDFGRSLALMHRAQRSERFGFGSDNWLGASPQANAWHASWSDFWRERRLLPQLATWEARAPAGDAVLALGRRLAGRVDVHLGPVREAAVLLHGDLWAGNAAALVDGRPAIFDPASYFGHREAEFGMMRLFGGFGPRVEAAYAEVWPFEPGCEERIALYRLYHELNHLNLFGTAYHGRCVETLRSLL